MGTGGQAGGGGTASGGGKGGGGTMRHRRFRLPEGVVLHYASVPNRDRAWAGPVPITSVRRTLIDCARDQVSPDLLRQAAQQALRRGLVTKPELRDVEIALEPFGGLAA